MGVPQDHAFLMKQRYPAGMIKVTATGLQCVGFNMELYELLSKAQIRYPLEGGGESGDSERRFTGCE
jgi:hypothetical protein